MTSKSSGKNAIKFTAVILKFGKKGEKSGWTYIDIPADVASKLNKGSKKSFRVKGFLDHSAINGIALIPMGDGNFIMPLNASIRKKIGKREGAIIIIQLQLDLKEPTLNKELMDCLEEEPDALAFFNNLPRSHQNYFSKWIDSAKTTETKAKRIARTMNALSRKMHYGEMLRAGI